MSPVAAPNSKQQTAAASRAAASLDWQQNWQFQSINDGAGDFCHWVFAFFLGAWHGQGANSICVKNTFSYCAYFKCYAAAAPKKQQQRINISVM